MTKKPKNMPSTMTLTTQNWSAFTNWVIQTDPGFQANVTHIGPTRVTVEVTLPNNTSCWINQDQTLTIDGLPWTTTIT